MPRSSFEAAIIKFLPHRQTYPPFRGLKHAAAILFHGGALRPFLLAFGKTRSRVRTGCSTAGRWRHVFAMTMERSRSSRTETAKMLRRTSCWRRVFDTTRLPYIIKPQVAERCSPPAFCLRLRRVETACYGKTGAWLQPGTATCSQSVRLKPDTTAPTCQQSPMHPTHWTNGRFAT